MIDSLPEAQPLRTIDLLTEDNNQLQIEFFRRGDQYFARYHFDTIITGKHLQFFAGYAKGKFYEIPVSAMEKINYAFTTAE